MIIIIIVIYHISFTLTSLIIISIVSEPGPSRTSLLRPPHQPMLLGAP